MLLFAMIFMAYAGNQGVLLKLETGGIPSIQIAVGSLYMFLHPPGLYGRFTQWVQAGHWPVSQRLLQATILVAGLMVFSDKALLGFALMLAAGEGAPRRGAFGLDTTTRANIMSAVTAQVAVNTTARTIVQAVK